MFKFFKKKKVKKKKEKNLKLVSLCLAFEVANADDDIDSQEKDLLLDKIKGALDTSVLSENEIFNAIKEESENRISFYDIIRDINVNLEKEEKIKILEMMWEVAYADRVLNVDEEKIIKRSADMLGIKPSIVLQTKSKFKV
tara:strand:+ start:416 stop:838 length:423 start_codon:yes stop_codon:yes gene_type:complete